AARDYLAIPASEVAVERLFSGGRDLLGLRRHLARVPLSGSPKKQMRAKNVLLIESNNSRSDTVDVSAPLGLNRMKQLIVDEALSSDLLQVLLTNRFRELTKAREGTLTVLCNILCQPQKKVCPEAHNI
ncbi:hypothetical protein V1509DRAFT_678595, partial [Lipomyces kononenkoae]